MGNSSGNGAPSTAELARLVVGKLAPEELGSFELVAAPYLANPRARERDVRSHHDDPLGFGAGEALAMLTPVAVFVSATVTAALADLVKEESRRGIVSLVRRLLRRKASAAAAGGGAGWTVEQLAAVRRVAVEKGRELGAAKPEAIADAILGALVSGQAGQAGQG